MRQRMLTSLDALRLLFLGLGILYALLGTSLEARCATNNSNQASMSDTILKLYRPFGDVVDQAAPVVKKKVQGQCDAQSQLILREDAWRCQAKGVVYDPCFVKPYGNKMEAVCPQSPWQGDSVLISVSSPLNNQFHKTLDMASAFPWAVELVGGERCQAVDVKQVYDSMPVRYHCQHHHLLFGYLQRCKSVWSMLKKTPQGVKTVDFKRAWF